MNLPPSLTRMRQLAPLALVLLSASVAVAAYLQVLDAPFFSDDEVYITRNTKLAGLHLAELWRLFTEPYNAMLEFLPLRELSYWFDMTLFGLNTSAFRLHNILLYLLCLPLVYGTTLSLWRYFRPADAASTQWAAAAVTALFAVHPTHVEAVVWISGRKDVLCGMFSLLALWLALNARRKHGLSPAYAATALLALLAAILSKAVAVAVAPVIALLWIIFWRDIPAPSRHRSILLWPLAILLLATCIAMIFAATITTRIPFYFGIEAVTRSLAALGWLARLTVSPESRHFFYPVLNDPWLPAMVTLGAATLAATAGGAVLLRQRSLEGFALVVFTLICLPSLQLIPYAPPSLVSDRFIFLAMWPVVLLAVALSWRLKPVPRTALLLTIALPWCFQTIERARDWRSYEAMLDADLRTYPGYYAPASIKVFEVQLKHRLFRDAGETANGITVPEIRDVIVGLVKAEYAVADAVSTGKPQNAMGYLWNLGLKLKHPPAQAKWDPAMSYVWKASQYTLAMQWKDLSDKFPDDVSVRYNAGLYLLSVHKDVDAVTHLRVATMSQRLPESVRGTAFYNLGLALMNIGYVAMAEAPLRAALEQSQPDLRAYCLLSKVYKQTKRFEEAARAEASCPNRLTNEETAQ